MATRSPVQIHNFWGAADSAGTPWTAGTLPNEAAGQTPLTLQAGDFAYVATSPSAGQFYLCTDAGTAGGADATWVPIPAGSGGIPITTSQYVVAVPGDDLAVKYAAAVALQGGTPSATSRSSLIVFPGTYTLSASLSFSAEYVDVIGLGAQPQRPAVRVEGFIISVTANDVHVEGIGTALSLNVGDNLPLQVFTNCKGVGAGSFGGQIGGGALLRGCSGVFNGCIGGLNSFGNSGGEISGQLYGCRALYGLFGNGENTTVLEYQTVTVTPGTPAVFTTASPHGYSVNDPIRLTTTGTPPTGMLANQTYFVASAGLTATDFTLVVFPQSIGIPPTVDTTDAGTGTQTVTSGRLVNCIDGYNDAVTI